MKHEKILFQLVSFWYRICIQPLQCAYPDKAFHIVNKIENYCTLNEFVVSTGWTDGYAGNVKTIGLILYVNLLWIISVYCTSYILIYIRICDLYSYHYILKNVFSSKHSILQILIMNVNIVTNVKRERDAQEVSNNDYQNNI